jgi:hypothetical protein
MATFHRVVVFPSLVGNGIPDGLAREPLSWEPLVDLHDVDTAMVGAVGESDDVMLRSFATALLL